MVNLGSNREGKKILSHLDPIFMLAVTRIFSSIEREKAKSCLVLLVSFFPTLLNRNKIKVADIHCILMPWD